MELKTISYLAGARGYAGDEAARGHLFVQERVQHAVRLALGKLALHVVGLRHGLKSGADNTEKTRNRTPCNKR